MDRRLAFALMGLFFFMGVSLSNVTTVAAQYQIDFWFLARSNALEVYYYADDRVRCSIFMASGNGIAPICFDRVPVSATPTP